MELEFFGCFKPSDLGGPSEAPPRGPSTRYAGPPDSAAEALGPLPGWYAVSVTFLKGEWSVDTTDPRHPRLKDLTCTYFNQFEPIATAGYSIYIYHLEPEEVNSVRLALGLPPWTPERHQGP